MRGLVAVAGVVGLLWAASPGLAQAPDGSAHRAGIERLAFMVGHWRGEAWMQRGPERVRTTMTERVERKLDGAVLLVEGLGLVPGPDSTAPRPVHQALAVVTFDPAAGTYGLRSYIATGQFGDFVLTQVPGGVSWTREVPGGRIRNTAHIGGDTWHEIGEFSRDGVAWVQIMEMNLRRVP